MCNMEWRPVEWNGDVITYLRWHWFFNAAQFLHSRVPADRGEFGDGVRV